MFKNKAGQVRSGWIIFLPFSSCLPDSLFLCFLVLLLCPLLEITQHGASVELDFNSMGPWMILMTQGAGTFGGLAATLVAWRSLNKRPVKELGVRAPDLDLVFGLLLGAASITLIFFILYITGNVTLLNSLSEPKITLYTFSFLILFILVGYFEELFLEDIL